MEDEKSNAVEFGSMTTLTPFSDASKEGDMVDMIRKIMSGQSDTNGSKPQSSDTTVVKKVETALKAEGESDVVEPKKTPDKIDGRTRDYRSTVSRITDGKKKKSGQGIDGRTKSYKTTMNRINTRRARKRG